ncbi:PAS/PAC sensor hybrid histidine kinase [Aliiroseovarius halocynthiae]|uniref:histidine kinase n=1 Tax=Aliiroseovarius halocynthiae TaxID=985055 RepID=A0A545SWP2_9RHOB|nr:ATP-binding protein [Aliiroseovarius halocynthiae]TQV69385.1 response regulator [Aliiroseovarius halocynthiae]SMR72774.1 PAS/PAC sensor hybrid histidine kinase [Aliiroseovarius halocynthiae]
MTPEPSRVEATLSRMVNSKTGLIGLAILAGLTLFSITVLSINVARDIGQLDSARSDNIQWTLTQAEVEFLELERAAMLARQSDAPDLTGLRREFDIFYSRINTLTQSSIYSNLREDETFGQSLLALRTFLNETTPEIDGTDADLLTALPQLLDRTQKTGPSARRLSNSALSYFANQADIRRATLLATLRNLAATMGILTFALIGLLLLLNSANRRNRLNMIAAQNSQSRTETIINTSLDAVIVTDLTGKVLDYNNAAELIFGHTRETALGKELGELIIPEKYRAAHAAGMERMRASGDRNVVGRGRVQLEGLRANGDVFPVELALQAAKTADGEVFVAFLRDISAKIAADKELIQARDSALESEQAKNSFLATMSHEIRTPLNGLLGSLALLRDTALNTKQSTHVANMEKSGRLLMNHISDVLDITTYDAGKLEPHLGPVNLSKLLKDIVSSQSGAAMAHHTTLEWGWKGNPVDWIETDKRKIQHILVNLIGNAIKFTHAGRIVLETELRADAPGKMTAYLRVSDTGCGIRPDMIEKIFDDFVTGDASYNRNTGGTGLGLGIVKRFVDSLGGTVTVDSTVGAGTVFEVSIPTRRVANPATPHAEEGSPNAMASLDILLVEDNEINQFVAKEMLLKAGHQVATAANGKLGVDQAHAHPFDLIFMDISMPVMDGREATRAIRAGAGASKTTPIVALTANVLPQEHEAFLADGMNDLITKPLDADTLSQITRKWVLEMSPPPSHRTPSLLSEEHFTEMREMIGPAQHAALFDRVSGEISDFLATHGNPTQNTLPNIIEPTHKIVGSTSAIGATDVSDLLRSIERAAKMGDFHTASQNIDNIQRVWDKTHAEFVVRSAGSL